MAKKVKKVPFDPKVFLATANGGRTLAKYRTDQVIFSQGDPADAVFYIQKGRVKVTVISEQGKEAIVAVMGPDDFCGEGCLTGQPRHLATAAAMTECEIMRLEKLTMIRVLHEEPAFSEMFIWHLLVRTIRVEADLVDQLSGGPHCRWLALRRAREPADDRPPPSAGIQLVQAARFRRLTTSTPRLPKVPVPRNRRGASMLGSGPSMRYSGPALFACPGAPHACCRHPQDRDHTLCIAATNKSAQDWIGERGC
jgi:CRP-like cAMP-binding protein